MLLKSNIRYIVVHYSASSQKYTTFDQINFWHKNKKYNAEKTMYKGEKLHVGYHYFIDGQARLHQGRKAYGEFLEMPAANFGLNPNSITICIALNVGEIPTPKQLQQLETLIRKLMKEYNIPVEKKDIKNKIISGIIGHRDVANILNDKTLATSCPGNILYQNLQAIKLKILKEAK